MPFARIDLAQGKSPEYRATVVDVVYGGLVEVLKAPDGDRFMIIGEHAKDNFVYDPDFLGIKRTDDLVVIQVPCLVHSCHTNTMHMNSCMAAKHCGGGSLHHGLFWGARCP